MVGKVGNTLPEYKVRDIRYFWRKGHGIRETAREVGVHRDTVMRYFRVFSGKWTDLSSNIVVNGLLDD